MVISVLLTVSDNEYFLNHGSKTKNSVSVTLPQCLKIHVPNFTISAGGDEDFTWVTDFQWFYSQ